ncbi:MAG: cytochrome c oxidase subunit II [Rickettsiales bacterium]|nr:MAG: cytochrome c oxidase subunit II [Rickettsiales bacterium]
MLPAFVLVAIALPSFKALYLADEILAANLTVKLIGHQWYWSYNYDDIAEPIAYDSYMVPKEDLEPGQLRMLEVDNPLVLPVGTIVRMLATSTDVIHSFAMPSLGIKIDCMPGRLNQVTVLANRTGTFYGQCSELCGAFHAFMPIKLDVVSPKQFVAWLKSQ